MRIPRGEEVMAAYGYEPVSGAGSPYAMFVRLQGIYKSHPDPNAPPNSSLPPYTYGSGFYISPGYVLTARHVLFESEQNATSGLAVDESYLTVAYYYVQKRAEVSESATGTAIQGANITSFGTFRDSGGKTTGNDIALVKAGSAGAYSGQYLGLSTFYGDIPNHSSRPLTSPGIRNPRTRPALPTRTGSPYGKGRGRSSSPITARAIPAGVFSRVPLRASS
jgi:hypothetical protein